MISGMANDNPPSSELVQCHNCDRMIGRLEPKLVWQQLTVCADCYQRLSGVASATASAASGNAPAAGERTEVTPIETEVFNGHPSVMVYLGSLFLGMLAVALGVIGVIYFWPDKDAFGLAMQLASGVAILCGVILFLTRLLQSTYITYRLTSQRLFVTTGILAKKTVETELFRVRDISLQQSLVERILRIGTVKAVTTDKDIAQMDFRGIRNPVRVKELLRQHVMEARQRTRTRDMDVADIEQNGTTL